jgi:hypothetical protein
MLQFCFALIENLAYFPMWPNLQVQTVWRKLALTGGNRGTQKLARLSESYLHDHSLESSWGALSEGTIVFDSTIFEGKCVFSLFLKKTQSLKSWN